MFRYIEFITMLFFSVMFSSCSFPDENMITLTLPTELPITDISGESPYMDLYVFDGEKSYHQFIREGQTEVTVPVRKGVLSLFTLTPYGRYSSVSAYLEPWMEKHTVFNPSDSQLITFLTDVGEKNPYLAAEAGITELKRLYPELDTVDKMKYLEYMEKGDEEDPVIPDLTGRKFLIEIETYLPGLWISDRADMSDFSVSHMSGKPVLELYEGVYHFFHENGRHHMMIVVTGNGRYSSRLELTDW